ncbi:hypothetical protein ANCCEY_11098 [Ancylostoma ceylanicum]|uniref:Potassium channel domain-containing protein n=1 Tax=Ancylostoma ceylanicum TaxID=53326 RepID=A0A0D6LF64_9BILA|nr:hypothetical protein ANCCEY_11098 [Ancylostoma ceylanicum]
MAQIGIRPENELQTRSRIVTNQLKDRDNCIVLKIDTQMTTVNNISPFGFHFELDKKRYKERKKQIRRQITRQFQSLQDLKETIVQMQGIIAEMTVDVINVTLSNNGTQRDEKVAKLIKTYYKTMLEAEGRFHGSVWHKAENLDMHLMWYYSSATFYSMTLFTTIGYGIGFPEAFYFTFISLTTIGLGDVMPYNIQYSPFLAGAFLLGLALVSIVNTSIYAQLYDMFFTFVEAREAKEEWDDAVRESFRVVKKPKKTVRMEIPAHIRKRTISDVAAHDEEHTHPQEQPQTSRRRAPTLGAMGGFDLAKFRKMHEDRRAYERDKKAKNAMSVVESDASTEESESEAETETVDGSPPMGSSRTYLI